MNFIIASHLAWKDLPQEIRKKCIGFTGYICRVQAVSQVSNPVYFDQLRDLIALKTFIIVGRDQLVTALTAVFLDLDLDQPFDPRIAEDFQVLDRAHAVVLPVAGIHAFDLFAGIVRTFKAERSFRVA